MALSHVEVIRPSEKIHPNLGGTGYLPPMAPATVPELSAAVRAGQIVWKVLSTSVNWRRPANVRLLNLGQVRIKCQVLGGTGYGQGRGYWYFVRVLP